MHDCARQGIAIGFFDGVHLGHQRVLSQARRVITFRNHPLSVLSPRDAPRLIMSYEEREAAIRSCGVEDIVALDFTTAFAALEPEDFAAAFLTDETAAPAASRQATGTRRASVASYQAPGTIIYCGANWRFGKCGRGDAGLLRRLGFDVRIWPFAMYRGERISSSRIRAAIEDASVADASQMLGRLWRVKGRIVAGKGLGRELGFPTVNLRLDDLRLNLPRGVYVVEVDGVRGVANWGIAPTMRNLAWNDNTLEIHFLEGIGGLDDGCGEMAVDFIRFLRAEKTFGDLDALKRQIALDCAAARRRNLLAERRTEE